MILKYFPFLFVLLLDFFSPSKQPVITPDQGTAWQTLHLFSQFLFVSLALQ